MLRVALREGIDSVIGARPVTAVARRLTSSNLRILAYHGVDDPVGFSAQLDHLRKYYHPVDAERVIAWLEGEASLPDGAVWVTFDDGEPSVVEHGLPHLTRLAVPSTMFVCPGLVDTDMPFWWQIAEEAERLDLISASDGLVGDPVAALKRISDTNRRTIVASLEKRIRDASGTEFRVRQISTAQLKEYSATGATLGNHTWDHPLLDQADPGEQRNQIDFAHSWFVSHLGFEPATFAFPNGNATEVAREVLARLSYRAALLFDHRLVSSRDPLAISRLRVNSHDSMERFAAILAGTHSGITRVRTIRKRRIARRGLMPL